ncbi:MAG: hypothetical protein ACPGQL_01405 [Thermoplasmatota archaeon]
MSDPVLVHIGYHKTATKWFQERLFPHHPDLVPLHRDVIAKALVWPHPLHFDPVAARAELLPHLEAAWQEGKVPVLSAERLSGNPTSGGFDAKEIAERIAATLPEARVWMQIREQRAAVASYYKQYVQEGGTARIGRFLAGDGVLKRQPVFRLEHWDYGPLVAQYRDLVGDDRLLVTLYEAFRDDADAVVGKVCAHAGVAVPGSLPDPGRRRNVSYSDLSIRIIRATNGLYAHPYVDHRPLLRLPGRRVPRVLLKGLDRVWGRRAGGKAIQNAITAAVAEHYVAGNQRLAGLLGVDLAERGYAVSSD